MINNNLYSLNNFKVQLLGIITDKTANNVYIGRIRAYITFRI